MRVVTQQSQDTPSLTSSRNLGSVGFPFEDGILNQIGLAGIGSPSFKIDDQAPMMRLFLRIAMGAQGAVSAVVMLVE